MLTKRGPDRSLEMLDSAEAGMAMIRGSTIRAAAYVAGGAALGPVGALMTRRLGVENFG